MAGRSMRAARLREPGAPLEVTGLPVPDVRPGGVLVRVEAAQVLPFTRAVIGGGGPFSLPVPYTLGSSAVGTVESAADDVFGLARGDRVCLDPYLTARVPGTDPAPLLIGWFGLNEAAAGPQRVWRDGTFAEYALWPAERVIPLRGLGRFPAVSLAPLTYLAIAYGALQRGGLRPGQCVVIVGATGNLGTAGVLVALAAGASRIVAAGRNAGVLAELEALDTRITAVVLTGAKDKDTAALAGASGGAGADLAVDTTGSGTGTAAAAEAALGSLRHRGTLVLAGGFSGPASFGYPAILARELTVRGSFMATPDAVLELAAMASAGTLRLDRLDSRVFPLDRVNEAIAAAAHGRGTHFTVLTP